MDDILLAPPTAYPVSLAEAKAQSREDTTDADQVALINAYIQSSTEQVENHLSRSLINQKRSLLMDQFPACINTMSSPFIKLDSIQYYDQNNTLQTLATTVYDVAKNGERASITLKSGQSWPLVESRPHAVQVNYYAGYSSAFTVDTGTDVITANNHGRSDGEIIRLWNSGGALPAGLSDVVNYFVINSTANTFEVSLTAGGAAVDITSAGTGAHFAGFMPKPIKQSILWLVGDKHENREAATPEKLNTLPFGVDQLLAPYVVIRF